MFDDDEERPPHKDDQLNVPMDAGLHDRARKKAGGDSRLRAIIRAFLDLWSSGEYPDLPDDVIEKHQRRAQKIPRKKKK